MCGCEKECRSFPIHLEEKWKRLYYLRGSQHVFFLLQLNSRYDANAEQEVVQWISQIVGENVPLGRENVQRTLKDGKILVRLAIFSFDFFGVLFFP